VAKILSAEMLALIPNGIENLTLVCTVCRGDLPNNRRAYGHHAGDCHKIATLHRRYVLRLTRCISCLHPATPAERADFKAWRRSRGELNERSGRRKGQIYSKPLPQSEDVGEKDSPAARF
jgi:hypothetical protein